jgi:hypothetical protein
MNNEQESGSIILVVDFFFVIFAEGALMQSQNYEAISVVTVR